MLRGRQASRVKELRKVFEHRRRARTDGPQGQHGRRQEVGGILKVIVGLVVDVGDVHLAKLRDARQRLTMPALIAVLPDIDSAPHVVELGELECGAASN